MLHQHAQFEDGSVSVEAGIMQMLSRMQRGRAEIIWRMGSDTTTKNLLPLIELCHLAQS